MSATVVPPVFVASFGGRERGNVPISQRRFPSLASKLDPFIHGWKWSSGEIALCDGCSQILPGHESFLIDVLQKRQAYYAVLEVADHASNNSDRDLHDPVNVEKVKWLLQDAFGAELSS